MDLNNPEIRQQLLSERLKGGTQIVAAEVADEFGVSVDTIRRDIISLENAGLAHRVRGGAVPVSQPMAPMHQRAFGAKPALDLIAAATLDQLADSKTLALDGGRSVLALARRLPAQPGLLVVTPSPWIAVACQERGIEVFLLGGKLSRSGGIAIGDLPIQQLNGIHIELALLGSCGLDPQFGLSSDDFEEVAMKRALVQAADRSFALVDQTKLGVRARYHTLALNEIDLVVTDARPSETNFISLQNVDVLNV